MADILPDEVVVAESTGALVDCLPRYPSEVALVLSSSPRRRAEFTSARDCARRALAELGHAPAAILRSPGGGPRWPLGVTGSLTHCAGYRAAAVSRSTDLLALGVDAEPHLPLPSGTITMVASAAERAHVAELSRIRPDLHWDRILFSAKESIFKAWYPYTHRWLGFEDADLVMEPSGSFAARLRVPAPRCFSALSGRWAVTNGTIKTALTIRP